MPLRSLSPAHETKPHTLKLLESQSQSQSSLPVRYSSPCILRSWTMTQAIRKFDHQSQLQSRRNTPYRLRSRTTLTNNKVDLGLPVADPELMNFSPCILRPFFDHL